MRSAVTSALSARSARAPALERRWLAVSLRRNPVMGKRPAGGGL